MSRHGGVELIAWWRRSAIAPCHIPRQSCRESHRWRIQVVVARGTMSGRNSAPSHEVAPATFRPDRLPVGGTLYAKRRTCFQLGSDECVFRARTLL
jgi:hypothetical protein